MNQDSKIIDGRKVRDQIFSNLKQEVEKLKYESKPKLAFVLVGNNPASHSYIRQKQKACREIGFEYDFKHFPESIQEHELLQVILDLNEDKQTHGVMVQLPLPNHINPDVINSSIDPAKDVDGFHPLNQGIVFLGDFDEQTQLQPCTPKGIIKLLDHYQVDIQGKNAVVIGRSQIVGKPISALLLHRGATVTVCHSKTKDLAAHTKQADILVVATGIRHLVKADMIKDGVIIIDVGFSKVEDDIYGDVDFESVFPKASMITPVPGGVGPMTVACLMENLFTAYQNQTS